MRINGISERYDSLIDNFERHEGHQPSFGAMHAMQLVDDYFLGLNDGMKKSDTKFDDSDSMFFARQLEYIEAQLYRVDLKVLKYRRIFPVDNAADPGADQITYRMYEPIGMAQVINNFADDLPRADVVAQEYRATVKPIGESIGFSVQDVRRSRFSGVPLDVFKMAAAQRGMSEKENSIAWNGDPVYLLNGLFNNTNIPLTEVALGATTGKRDWAEKNADEIIFDVGAMVSNMRVNTKGARQGNSLILPIPQFTLITTKPRSTISDTTVAEFILRNKSFGIEDIDWVNELQGSGPVIGGVASDQAFYYERNPEVMQLRIPLERMLHPMRMVNLEFVIPIEARNAGIVTRYPFGLSLNYGL